MMPARPLRVAHVVPALFGPTGVTGGAERYVLELARAMSVVTPTTLITFAREAGDLQLDGLRVVTLRAAPVRGQRTNPFTFRLAGALSGADVVHCHQTHVLSSSFAVAVARLTGRRAFTTDLGGGGMDVSSYVSTDRWYHGHLHISEYSRRISGHGDKPWARVISGGVDALRFSPKTAVQRDGTVLFVGRLLPHKGLDDLIEAIPPAVRAEIIGEPHDPTYFATLQANAAGKNIVFRTHVDDEQLVEAYRRAACIVLPSVYRTRGGLETTVPELLGQTLLEGMACEAPGVCTSVASLPEVVQDGETGFVVPPGDPATLRERLLWILEHPGEARAMGAGGRRRVLEHFSWSSVVDRCLSAYTQ